MQLPPASAQAALPAVGGRDRQCQQHHQSRKAHRDVGPFGDVLEDQAPIEFSEEPQVEQKMERQVGEGEQPHQAADAQQRRVAKPSAQGGYAQGQQQRAYPPLAEKQQHRLARIRAQRRARQLRFLVDGEAKPGQGQAQENPSSGLQQGSHGYRISLDIN